MEPRTTASRPIQPFGQTIDASITARFVDVRLAADDGVGEDLGARLDDDAFVDEARAVDLDAVLELRAPARSRPCGRRRQKGGAE